MAKIKVLHIITRIASGGAEENTLYTVNGLDPEEFQIDLITGKECNSELNIELNNSVRLFRVRGLVREISPLNDLWAFLSIYKIIKAGDYDIVHTHIAKAGVIGRIAARLAGVPLIVHTIHGITFPDTISRFKQNIYRCIERFCSRFTESFIPVGEDMRNKYLEAGIGSPDKYRVIYSGMALERFRKAAGYNNKKIAGIRERLGLKEDEIIIGNVASLEARKGHEYYLQVAAQILANYTNVKFLIIGDGPRRKELEEMSRSLGIEEKIIFTGYRHDIEDMFAIIDIKVLTSLWEGLPRVLIQAATVGRPIVTFAVDGVWEIVKNGENGFVVPVRDVEQMTEALSILIEDDMLRKNMGIRGREKSKDSWSIKNMVDGIVIVYKELINKMEGSN